MLYKVHCLRPYLPSIIYFSAVFIVSTLIRFFVSLFLGIDISNSIFRISILLFSIILIYKYRLNLIIIPKREHIKRLNLFIIIGFVLIVIFTGNNYYMIITNNRFDYFNITGFNFKIANLYISCFAEELLYRGLIQTSINNKLDYDSDKLQFTKGNLVATSLMTITHLGFFFIIPFLFAFTSLVLVFIFSLLTGLVYDRYKNISFPIILHVSVNSIHIFIHSFF